MLLEWVDFYGLLFLAPFLVLELFWRARRYELARGWRWRAAAVTLGVFGFTFVVGRAWGAVLPQWSLVDGAALGTWGGALAGVLVYEFLHYWYHRLAHQWDWLWRLGHQMHHSAESVDAFGAYYLHPLDAALFTTCAVIAFYPRARAYRRGGRHRFSLPRVQRRVPAREHPYPVLARLPDPAAGKPRRAPRPRHSPLELRRPAAVGHGVRHVPQPSDRRERSRLLPRRVRANSAECSPSGTSLLLRDLRQVGEPG